jgi:hypothetical protein
VKSPRKVNDSPKPFADDRELEEILGGPLDEEEDEDGEDLFGGDYEK